MNKPNGELIRVVKFSPFRKGMGPWFMLRLYDLNKYDPLGKSMLGYELIMHERPGPGLKGRTVLFSGEDFAASPTHSVDSDATVRAIMGFLTLRPGDTDADYFDNYTTLQRSWAERDAETLAMEVINRFGED